MPGHSIRAVFSCARAFAAGVAISVAGAASIGAMGCGRTPDLEPRAPVGSAPAMALAPVFTQTVNNDIDIVFMIDNSMSMEQEQANLQRNFPAFTNVLKNLPQGLPNVHIAVVSSDLGAGPFTGIMDCHPGGDQGRFQHAPRAQGGACTSAPRDAYISAVGPNRNFTGDIDDAFSCIAPLGTSGCGFEHQLQSVRVALDPDLMPPENRGFLRDGAVLAIILLTDEDDCSAPDNTTLFDPDASLVTELGPLQSFRCNRFGHLCNGQPPPETAAANLQNCHSAEDGRLIRISELATFFKSLKTDPNDVMVAAVTGPPTPYSVITETVRTPSGREVIPQIAASCMSANGLADPAVRIQDFVDAFGDNGSFLSICSDDFSPVMTTIGQQVARRASLDCLAARIVDVDPTTDGVQPHCEVFDQTTSGGSTLRQLIPACATSNGATPCWRVQASSKCLVSGLEMIVDRGGAAPVAGTRPNAICETCQTAGDPRCP